MENNDTRIDKILALLAKAESSGFDEERDAFLNKAQQMMAQHRIDEADIAAARDGHLDQVGYEQIHIGHGVYVLARCHLLSQIAAAMDCRACTYTRHDGRNVEIWGYASDRRIVKTLYATLLMQATSVARSTPTPDGQVSMTFRKSFILGFADRIHDRLAATRTHLERDAAAGSSTAMVLVERGELVDQQFRDRYPNLGRLNANGNHSESGYRAGDDAGRRANLSGSQSTVGAGTKGSIGRG